MPYPAGFYLSDFSGKKRTLADFAGKVVVMYFGYTQCPDICPASMQVVAQAMTDLGDKAKDVQFLFVTVDPQRDTPEILKAYETFSLPGENLVNFTAIEELWLAGRYGWNKKSMTFVPAYLAEGKE